MKTPLAVLLLVALLVSAGSSDAKPGRAKPSASSDLARLPVEKLIARFQHEPAARILEDEQVDIDTFVAVPSPTGLRVDWRGTSLPRVSPTLRELVRRGAAAVPALLDGLSDARPTRLVLAGSNDDAALYVQHLGSEYEPRQPDANGVPAGLSRVGESEPGRGVERFKTYRLKVGDLCYAALGQIVNRRLLALRNGSGAMMYGFNSPVRSPALAAAARADWAGLTDDGLRDFLIHDVEWLEQGDVPQPRNLYALQRLLFYYPADGVALAVKLLDRPLIDPTAAKACCERLTETDDEAAQDRLLADFQAQHGQDEYQYLTQSVAGIAAHPLQLEGQLAWMVERRRTYENAVKLANRRFSEADRHPTFVGAQLDCAARELAVVDLTPYPSAEIDAAIRQMLARAFALRIENWRAKEDQRDLAVACVRRLLPAARSKEYDKARYMMNRKFASVYGQEEKMPAYVRACDALLQKMAAEPALRPPAASP